MSRTSITGAPRRSGRTSTPAVDNSEHRITFDALPPAAPACRRVVFPRPSPLPLKAIADRAQAVDTCLHRNIFAIMVPGGMIARTCLCCRREFVYGVEFQVLGREPKYCHDCGEHHQQLALVPKTRKRRAPAVAKKR
jgi:hypothetical protein